MYIRMKRRKLVDGSEAVDVVLTECRAESKKIKQKFLAHVGSFQIRKVKKNERRREREKQRLMARVGDLTGSPEMVEIFVRKFDQEARR